MNVNFLLAQNAGESIAANTVPSGLHKEGLSKYGMSDTLFVSKNGVYESLNQLETRQVPILVLQNIPRNFKYDDYKYAFNKKYADGVRQVVMVNCEIKRLPAIHHYFKNLEGLNLTHCRLSKLELEDSYVNPNVVSMVLDENQIRKISPEFFFSFPSLSSLSLASNNLTSNDVYNLASNEKIKILNLAGNKVDNFGFLLSSFPALEELYLSGNKISYLGSSSDSTLITLYLDSNSINSVDNNLSFLSLEWLDLSHNYFSEFPHFVFNSKKLRVLNLLQNPLSHGFDEYGKFFGLSNLEIIRLPEPYFLNNPGPFIFELAKTKFFIDQTGESFIPAERYTNYHKYAENYKRCFGDGNAGECFTLSGFYRENGFTNAYLQQVNYIIAKPEWQCTGPWIAASYKMGAYLDNLDSTEYSNMGVTRSRSWFMARDKVDFDDVYENIRINKVFNHFNSICNCQKPEQKEIAVLISNACSKVIDELSPIPIDIKRRYDENTSDITRLREEIPELESQIQKWKVYNAKKNSASMTRINKIANPETKKKEMSKYNVEVTAQEIKITAVELQIIHKGNKINKTIAENEKLKGLLKKIEKLIYDAKKNF